MKSNNQKEQRIQQIIRYVTTHKEATVEELSSLCNVSAMTIHRDLSEIDGNDNIVKIRGGARLVQGTMEHFFTDRTSENAAQKDLIGEKTASLLTPGIAVYLDAGTTTLAVARHMPDIDINLFTTAPTIAMELLRTQKPSINLCAGNLDRNNLMLTGYFTLAMIDQINIDVAILATSGFSPQCGFTCAVETQMAVKQAAIRRAKKVYMVMDSSKIGKDYPFTFTTPEEVDCLIMESEPPSELAAIAEKYGITII